MEERESPSKSEHGRDAQIDALISVVEQIPPIVLLKIEEFRRLKKLVILAVASTIVGLIITSAVCIHVISQRSHADVAQILHNQQDILRGCNVRHIDGD